MKAKNVSLNTLLYVVEADKIKAVRPGRVEKIQNGKIRIEFNNSYRGNADAYLEDEKIGNYYLNFSDAKNMQMEMRKRVIKSAYDNMQKAIDEYNKIIEKYFDKPLTSDSEVEILNC